ncbi:hypothetical protein [Jatrophihabitans fulvus]
MLDTAPQRALGRPRAVVHAARLMVAAAAVSLVSLVVLLLELDEFRRLLRDVTPPPPEASVDTAVRVTVVGYVSFLLLFPLLARHVTQGRNWARLATWLLAGISLVTTFSRLGRHQPVPTRMLDVAGALLAVGIVVLLLARPSSRFFRPR